MDKVKITIIILISLVWGIFIYTSSLGSLIKYINTNVVSLKNANSIQIPPPPITKGDKLKQIFKGSKNGLYNIEVMIGNYGRVNNSTLCFSIKNLSTNQDLSYKCHNVVNFVNDALYTINFKTQIRSKNQKFLFEAYSPNGTSLNSVTLWELTNTNNKNNNLYLNGKLQKNNLYMLETYNNNYSFFQSLKMIYQKLYPKNPYLFKGRYIYLIILLYPIIIFILLVFSEFLLLYKKSIKNIIITNIIIGLVLFSMNYFINNTPNLNIGCYLQSTSCASPIHTN